MMAKEQSSDATDPSLIASPSSVMRSSRARRPRPHSRAASSRPESSGVFRRDLRSNFGTNPSRIASSSTRWSVQSYPIAAPSAHPVITSPVNATGTYFWAMASRRLQLESGPRLGYPHEVFDVSIAFPFPLLLRPEAPLLVLFQ